MYCNHLRVIYITLSIFLLSFIGLSAQPTTTVGLSNTGTTVTVNLNIMGADAGCLEAGTLFIMIPVGVTVCNVMSLNGTTWTESNLGTYGTAPSTPYQVFQFEANPSNDMTDTANGSSVDVFSFELKGCTAGQMIRLKEPNSAIGGLAPTDADREFAIGNAGIDHAISLVENTGAGACNDTAPNGTAYQGAEPSMVSLTCPLPVELTSFLVTGGTKSIDLNWESATEFNFDGYELQRSLDGINFEKMAWVQGSENSLESKRYNYSDINVKANITYYYRLKMIDLDEAFEFSPIRSAQIGGKGDAIAVYPNPTNTTVNLTIDVPNNDRVSIRFYDTTGKVAMERVQDLNEGGNVLQYNVSELPSGIYRIIIEGQQVRATQNVVVMD